MAGYDNIKDKGFDTLSTDERRKMASIGGKASVEARRRKKSLRELFAMIGNMPVTDKTLLNRIKSFGLSEEDITWNLAMAVSTYVTAVKKGDTKTVALILKLLDDVDSKKENNKFDEFMNDVE